METDDPELKARAWAVYTDHRPTYGQMCQKCGESWPCEAATAMKRELMERYPDGGAFSW